MDWFWLGRRRIVFVVGLVMSLSVATLGASEARALATPSDVPTPLHGPDACNSALVPGEPPALAPSEPPALVPSEPPAPAIAVAPTPMAAAQRDADLLAKSQRLETQIRLLHRFSGQPRRAIRRELGQSFERVQALLMAGAKERAFDLVKGLFETTEVSYLLLRSIAERNDDSPYTRGQVAALEARFGRNWLHYADMRTRLTELPNKLGKACSQRCSDAIAYVLQRVGVNNPEALNFASLNQAAPPSTNTPPPAMQEMESYFRNHPAAVFASLAHERRLELLAAARVFTLQPAFLKLAETVARRTPYLKPLKLLYDGHARFNDFERIGEIMAVGEDTKYQMEMLMGIASADQGVMRTFSRRLDYATTERWKKLKEFAKDSEPAFYERMLVAESEGKNLGGISLLYDSSPAAKLGLVLAAGAATVGGHYAYNSAVDALLPASTAAQVRSAAGLISGGDVAGGVLKSAEIQPEATTQP